MDVIRPFAGTKDYTRSPLGVIGLFMVLVYGLGTISFNVENTLTADQRWVMLGFVVLFPLVIFVGFLYLVRYLLGNLYGPTDFRSDEAFLTFVRGFARIEGPIVATGPTLQRELDAVSSDGLSKGEVAPELEFTPHVLDEVLLAVYFQQRGIFLGHIASQRADRPSVCDVAIFLTGSDAVRDVQRAEFYFGSGWRSKIFTARPDRAGRLGVVVSANGGFLALCRVTLNDGSILLLNHYCNLEGAGVTPQGPDGSRGRAALDAAVR